MSNLPQSQSTSSQQDSLRSGLGDMQTDIAVRNRGTASVFAPTPHSQTGSDRQLSTHSNADPFYTNSNIDLSPFYRAPPTHSHPLPMIHSDSNTITHQNIPLTHHDDTTAQSAGSDQPWDISLWPWSPPPEPDTPKAQHRESTTPPIATCVSPTSVAQQPRPHTSILHLSIASGNCDILKMLLQADEIYIDEEDSAGYTPLQRAIMAGRADMVALLLEHGADINNCRD